LIPIVLLHHNQPDVLLQAVEHIKQHTIYPYRLFVVDNSSVVDLRVQEVLARIELNYGVLVIKNAEDNWIYGFNLAMQHEAWVQSKYYAFSDADILVPEAKDGVCWLRYLINQMDANCCIGKLGLSLDHANLQANPALSKTLSIERGFLMGPKIGTNIVSPVDTTMALYRNDFFITDFRFRIGHASLARPYYFTCRTTPEISAIHVGWDFYPGSGEGADSADKRWKKALIFCFMGASVAPELISDLKFHKRYFLEIMLRLIRIKHGVKVSYFMFIYLLKRFPRCINDIQAQQR